ncbi:MOSC domain-containing protein [Acidisphaera sp. L21]|uniref:MOSC domain-containing protein n=1 Tax=Acidisphaera sp. L21 TaxID=1641851 RepID=UPI0020B1327A|nr:MOSC domain-containing protein [Acidisphaera sp. L21]
MVRAGAPAVALNPNSPLARLLGAPVRPGVVRWIGLRPGRREPLVPVQTAMLEPGVGLVGDRWSGRPTGGRQVSLLAEEHLHAIASFLGREVSPDLLRRNILVRGINLLALKDHQVRIGAALLEISGECHPCSRMEEIFGPGGYNAVRGQGGMTARVIEPGEIRVGDPVARVD